MQFQGRVQAPSCVCMRWRGWIPPRMAGLRPAVQQALQRPYTVLGQVEDDLVTGTPP